MEDIILKTSVCNGIGDRLLDVIGFSVLCSAIGILGHINWSTHDHGFKWGSAIYDLRLFDFSKLTYTQVIPAVSGTSTVDDNNGIIEVKNHNACMTLSPYNVWRNLCEKAGHTIPYEEVLTAYIYVASRIHPSSVISPFIPHHISDYTAVHLRRTDKVSQCANPVHETFPDQYNIIIDKLVARIENDIKTSEDPCKYFILSDDPEYKQQFTQSIRDIAAAAGKTVHIHLTQPEDLPEHIRIDYTGAYDLYEFFTLTKCKQIYQGIKYSTFSLLAALMTQKPLINFHQHEDGWLLYAWQACLDVTIDKDHKDHVICPELIENTVFRWNRLAF